MMRKNNEGRSPAGILLPAAAAGLMATLLLMLVGAVLMHQGTLPEGAVAPCALVFLAAGGLLAGLVAAKCAAGRKLPWALGAGFVVFLIVGVLLQSQPVNPVRVAVSLLCVLAASALGGFAGANMRKKKRYSHVKK